MARVAGGHAGYCPAYMAQHYEQKPERITCEAWQGGDIVEPLAYPPRNKDAEKWIAEYNKAMSTVPTQNENA